MLKNEDCMNLFGLNKEQISILYSMEYLLVKRDIMSNPKNSDKKEQWLEKWTNILNNLDENEDIIKFVSLESLIGAIKKEASSKDEMNNTWLYLIFLEATLFNAYTPLSEDREDAKEFAHLKYRNDIEYLKILASETNIVNPDYIKRFKDTYSKSIDKITGKVKNMTIVALSVVAVSAIAAATAGALAGPIAVAFFGGNFAGLHGAALTSACLAFAGGGALAMGGAGMAGGAAAIVGGGALLGAAVGGAGAGVAGALINSSPKFVLTQAAKLEVVMKEILLNANHDIVNAQLIMNSLKEKIHELQRELDEIKLAREDDKKALNNLNKSLSYLRKAYEDMRKYESSFEVGYHVDGEFDNAQ